MFIFICINSYAADSELQDLGEETAPIGSDVLYMVDDPSGTDASKKVTFTNAIGSIFSSNTETNITATYQSADHTVDLTVQQWDTFNASTGGADGSASVDTDDDTFTFVGASGVSVAISSDVLTIGNRLGTTIDDTEMTSEDFGDFTCDGTEDGCTINSNAVALSTDTTGNYLASVADAGNSTISASSCSGSEGASCTLDVVDLNCTDCIGTTEISDSYVLNAGDTMTGQLFVDGGANEIQALIQGNGTQTANILVAEESDGTDVFVVFASGVSIENTKQFNLPKGTSPTLDSQGEVAVDIDTWQNGRGTIKFWDGTEETNVISALSSDSPTSGQVPKWNTGGTITWEDDSTTVGSTDLWDTFYANTGGKDGQTTADDPNDILTVAEASGVTVSISGDTLTIGSLLNTTIDDTEMTSEDFGDWTCDGSEDGCTLNTDSVADNEIDYSAVTCTDLTMTDCGNITSSSTVNFSSATITVPTASSDDNDTSAASTAFVQQEINGAGGTDLTCSGGQCNVDDAFIQNDTSDTMTGTLTADGLTLGANENITLGAETLDHDGTNFVFTDSIFINGSDDEVQVIVQGNGTQTNDIFVVEESSGSDVLTVYASGVTVEPSDQLLIPVGASPSIDGNGEIAIDTTEGQLKYQSGPTTNVLIPKVTKCITVENLAAADDALPMFSEGSDIDLLTGWCHCKGTCTTEADIMIEEETAGSGASAPYGDTLLDCEDTPSGDSKTTFSSSPTVEALNMVRFFVNNAVSPETDEYQICVEYKYTAK